MMKFKKLLAATMTGAMLLGVVATALSPVVSVYAEDAAKSAYTIEIDYENYCAIISSDTKSDPYVVLEILKENKNDSKVSNTYTYEMNGESSITVDLSFLKASKASYLRVHGSSETVTSGIVTVNAQPAKLSLKYTSGQMTKKSPEENLAAAFANGKTKIEADKLDLYEYRTLYGSNFQSLANLDQATAEIAGTTIIIRKAAIDDSETETENAPASAEVKVKIAAAPKAPKVTVDYAKGSIKLPKKTQAQIVYAGEGTAAVAASMTLKTGMDTGLYGKSGEDSFAAVTNGNLEDYFTVADDGTVSVKQGCTFATSEDGNTTIELDEAAGYVEGTPAVPASSGSDVTEWKDCAATPATPEEILGWFFKETDEKETIDNLIKSGFTLVVRTKADKKAASNANILVIDGAAVATKTEGKNEVKVGTDTLTWATAKNGIVYTGTGFEYYDASKSKWVAIKSGSTVKTTVTTDTKVKVRKAGVKAGKTTAGVLPSASIEITVPKYEDSSSTTTPTPTPTPTPTVEDVTVKVGDNVTEVTAGAKVTCTATVTGSKGVAQDVTWRVAAEDAESPIKSTISETGELSVAADEEKCTLVITATSTVDPTKSGTAEIIVK